MSLSIPELQQVIDEISPRIRGGFLQQISAPAPTQLALQFYGRGINSFLLVTLTHGSTRLHLVERKPASLPTPPPFIQFLRKHLGKQPVAEIRLVNDDRIVEIRFANHILIFELFDKQSEVWFTDTAYRILAAHSYLANRKGEIWQHPHLNSEENRGKKAPSSRFMVGTLSVCQQIAQHYQDQTQQSEISAAEKNWLNAIKRQQRKITHLESDLNDTSQIEPLHQEAETLKTQLGNTAGITAQAVQEKFAAYKKLKRKRAEVESRLAIEKTALEKLQRANPTLNPLSPADPRTAGPAKPSRPKIPGVLEAISEDGIRVLLGRNAQANDTLLRMAQGNDLWLHVQGFPSAHCIILRNRKQEIPDRTLLFAARLTIAHSKAKNQAAADVIVARRCDVKKPKGAKPGQVSVLRSKTLHVRK